MRDCRELGAFKKRVDDTFDHCRLNEAMGEDVPPSAENLAVWIFDLRSERLPELTAVRVSETPKTRAASRPAGRGGEDAPQVTGAPRGLRGRGPGTRGAGSAAVTAPAPASPGSGRR